MPLMPILTVRVSTVDVFLNRVQRDKEDLVTDSGRASDQLTAISRQLADTVRRSALTVDELTESSRVVSETHEEFKGMGAVLGHSRYRATIHYKCFSVLSVKNSQQEGLEAKELVILVAILGLDLLVPSTTSFAKFSLSDGFGSKFVPLAFDASRCFKLY